MGAFVFALAQGRRAAFRRQIGFPNVKLANRAGRETWKRYHELLAKFPGLRAEHALLISRKDHRERYEQLMRRTASFPLLSMPREALFQSVRGELECRHHWCLERFHQGFLSCGRAAAAECCLGFSSGRDALLVGKIEGL
jgi:hypothetical protein